MADDPDDDVSIVEEAPWKPNTTKENIPRFHRNDEHMNYKGTNESHSNTLLKLQNMQAGMLREVAQDFHGREKEKYTKIWDKENKARVRKDVKMDLEYESRTELEKLKEMLKATHKGDLEKEVKAEMDRRYGNEIRDLKADLEKERQERAGLEKTTKAEMERRYGSEIRRLKDNLEKETATKEALEREAESRDTDEGIEERLREFRKELMGSLSEVTKGNLHEFKKNLTAELRSMKSRVTKEEEKSKELEGKIMEMGTSKDNGKERKRARVQRSEEQEGVDV